MADETFGVRLKRCREQADMTQQELADKAGLNRFSVAKLEQDQYSPTWPTVQALAKALGLRCTAFEGTIEPPKKDDKVPGTKGRPRKTAVEPEEAPTETEQKPKKRKK